MHSDNENSMSRSQLWRNRAYRWWLAADTSWTLGSGLVSFALPLLVVALGGSTGLATSIASLSLVVSTVVGLVGGVVQDRYDRRLLMVLGGLANATVLAALAVLVHLAGRQVAPGGARVPAGAGSLLGGASPWLVALLGVVAALALVSGLLGGTSNAMLRGVVPDADLAQAMTANSARDGAVHLLSGPLGGALLALGRAWPALAGAALALVSALCALPIRTYWRRREYGDDADAAPAAASQPSSAVPAARTEDAVGPERSADAGAAALEVGARASVSTALSGLTWILRHRFQRRFILTGALAAGAGNTFLLLTVLHVNEVAGAEGGSAPVSAGVVNTVAAAGMLAGAFIATPLINRVRSGLLVSAMFATLTAGLTLAAVAGSLPATLVLVPMSLLLLPAGSSVLGAFFNVLISHERLGRVMAGENLLTYLVLAVLTAASGQVMSVAGYRTACLGLAGVLVAAAASALSLRPLVTLPTPEHWSEHVAAYELSTF